jgi:hypothetical protein
MPCAWVGSILERAGQRVIPFFEFPEEIRKIIYTTNAVESLHMTLRKVTKNRGSLKSKPSHEGEARLHKIIDTTVAGGLHFKYLRYTASVAGGTPKSPSSELRHGRLKTLRDLRYAAMSNVCYPLLNTHFLFLPCC